MNAFDFGISNYPELIARVDGIIKDSASKHIGGLERILSVNGKRYRPSIILAIVFHKNKTIDDSVLKAAAAIELIHLATLVHDDIMDEGLIRHGLPTINSSEGPDQALLAGDYLIARGLLLASQVRADVAETLAETVAWLCDGQAIEINDNFNLGRTEASLLQAIRGKTSSLFIVAAKIGGMLAGLSAKQISSLSSFADNFGIAYQYIDDVNDFEATGKSSKSLGNDVREGNYTLPIILSLKGSNSEMLKNILGDNPVSEDVVKILQADNSIAKTKEKAKDYMQTALSELENLQNPDIARSLANFVNKI